MTLTELATLLGTALFAASGARVGVRKGFDLLGVFVLGCVTAVGGGSLRDVLTGQTPPQWFRDERLLWAALAGSLLAFLFFRRLDKRESELDILDAAGLALFSASAALRGIELGFGPLGIVFVGTVSGVGGGVIRDILAREIPGIFLPGALYASAAILGSLTVYALHFMSLSDNVLFSAGALIIFLVRLLSMRYQVRLPTHKSIEPETKMPWD
jgi:uncharacterized membrane protein YeiH